MTNQFTDEEVKSTYGYLSGYRRAPIRHQAVRLWELFPDIGQANWKLAERPWPTGGTPSTNADQPDHLEIVDVVRDDMFTVLFQKRGVRYVVVTLPEHEAWLTDILRSWQFTD